MQHGRLAILPTEKTYAEADTASRKQFQERRDQLANLAIRKISSPDHLLPSAKQCSFFFFLVLQPLHQKSLISQEWLSKRELSP